MFFNDICCGFWPPFLLIVLWICSTHGMLQCWLWTVEADLGRNKHFIGLELGRLFRHILATTLFDFKE